MITQKHTTDPFAIDRALLDTPAAQHARAAGLLDMKRQAASRAEKLAGLARPLLVAVIAVSAVHIFGQVARFAPASAAALTLPAWAYHGTAAALTGSIDLVALYLVAAAGALRLAGQQMRRRALGFFLALTFALNLAYMAQHAPALRVDALLPWLDGLFVLLLPAFIPIALLSVEGAAQALDAARLALQVEAAALAGVVGAQAVEQPARRDVMPSWSGPILVAQPAASWPREQGSFPAPVAVQAVPMAHSADTRPEMPAEAVRTACSAPTPYACPRCDAPLTAGAYGAAKRHGHCRNCKA